jgi:hypothetical protein
MPNRVIREGILDSEKVSGLSEAEQNFFFRLLLIVDDYGRFDARPGLLRSKCYPVDDSKTLTMVSNMLTSLHGANLIELYTVGEKSYLHINEFNQRLRQKREKFPGPEKGTCQQHDSNVRADVSNMRPESNPIRNDLESESESESETNHKSGGVNVPPPEPPNWKEDINIYYAMVDEAYKTIIEDNEEILRQEKFSPSVDIKLSIEKGMHNFWRTEAGWKHKKKSRAKEIDMKTTLINSISMNKVYKAKNDHRIPGVEYL